MASWRTMTFLKGARGLFANTHSIKSITFLYWISWGFDVIQIINQFEKSCARNARWLVHQEINRKKKVLCLEITTMKYNKHVYQKMHKLFSKRLMFSNPTDATSFHQSIILSEGKGTEEQDGELQCVINWAALLLSVRSRSASHHFTWWPTLRATKPSALAICFQHAFLCFIFFVYLEEIWVMQHCKRKWFMSHQHQGAQKRAGHLMVLEGRSSAPTALWTFPQTGFMDNYYLGG